MWEIRLQRSWPLGLPVSAAFSCLPGNGRNRVGGGGGQGHAFQTLVAAEPNAQHSEQGWSWGASGCGQRKLRVFSETSDQTGAVRGQEGSLPRLWADGSPASPIPSTRPEGSGTSQPAAAPGDGQAASWLPRGPTPSILDSRLMASLTPETVTGLVPPMPPAPGAGIQGFPREMVGATQSPQRARQDWPGRAASTLAEAPFPHCPGVSTKSLPEWGEGRGVGGWLALQSEAG